MTLSLVEAAHFPVEAEQFSVEAVHFAVEFGHFVPVVPTSGRP